jgi:predicted small metal-binding protein
MDPDLVTNRCACGWEMTGPVDEVVAATIDHGKRIHNMVATRDEVLAALGRAPEPAPDQKGVAP